MDGCLTGIHPLPADGGHNLGTEFVLPDLADPSGAVAELGQSDKGVGLRSSNPGGVASAVSHLALLPGSKQHHGFSDAYHIHTYPPPLGCSVWIQPPRRAEICPAA
ncbi:hypothetical protein D3C71_1763270 [compost metagenome]